MNAEIWTKAAQFPKKVYINGIFLSVLYTFTKPCFHKSIFLAVPPPPCSSPILYPVHSKYLQVHTRNIYGQ